MSIFLNSLLNSAGGARERRRGAAAAARAPAGDARAGGGRHRGRDAALDLVIGARGEGHAVAARLPLARLRAAQLRRARRSLPLFSSMDGILLIDQAILARNALQTL